MATPDAVEQLRLLTGYNGTDPFDDPELSAMIDELGMNSAASKIWSIRAADFATLVDTSESGSTRKLGDAHKNALTMAKYFADLAGAEVEAVDLSQYARTRAIVRESA